ncbi:helix-turn-helix domain-containing protein [Paenibacillus sp. H1-7]|nr:helix-turn-helix domain-containing protein [Paenibacillus sp. H1-7]
MGRGIEWPEKKTNASPAASLRKRRCRAGLRVAPYSRFRFKQMNGMSPQQYIVKLKLEKARTMLLESTRSVTRIAEQPGYPSIHCFSNQFGMVGISTEASIPGFKLNLAPFRAIFTFVATWSSLADC